MLDDEEPAMIAASRSESVVGRTRKRFGALAAGTSQGVRKLRNLSHVVWGQAFGALCALVATRAFTELLSTTQFGYAMLGIGCFAFLDSFVIMAFNQTVLSLCGRIEDISEQQRTAAGLAVRLIAVVALASLPIGLLWIGACAMLHWTAMAWLMPVGVLTYLMFEIAKISMIAPLIANGEYFKYSLWIGVEALVSLLIPAVALIVLQRSAITYVSFFIVARALSTSALFLINFRGRYFKAIPWDNVRQVTRVAFQYGWPVSLMGPLGWVASYIDRYLLSAIAGPSATGVYTASVGLVGRPFALTTSVLTNYFRPMLYRAGTAVTDDAHRKVILHRWALTALAIGLTATLAVAGLAHVIASVALAAAYRAQAAPIMIFMALAQTFTITTHSADNAVLASGASARLLRAQLGFLVITLIAIPTMTALAGAVGATAGRCIAESLKCGLTYLLATRVLRNRAA